MIFPFLKNYTVNSEVTGVTITAKDPDAGTAGQVFFSIEVQQRYLQCGYRNFKCNLKTILINKF